MKITRKWKKILSTALACLLLVGAVGAVASFATNDQKTVSSLGFVLGDIDPDTGEFVESKKSVYTEKTILANGLKIKPDFEFKGTYDVFYYDANNILITKKLGLDGIYKSNVEIAQYCRIVIHPDVPDGVKEKDYEINFFEAKEIASMFTITISKGLNKYGNYEDYFDGVQYQYNKGFENDNGTITSANIVAWDNFKVSEFVALEDAEKVGFVMTYIYPPVTEYMHLVFVDENNTYISDVGYGHVDEAGLGHYILDVPEGAVKVAVMCASDVTVRLYSIND